MDSILKHKPEFDKVVEHFNEEIGSLRTGRATPALVENVNISAYGTLTRLKQLGSIAVSDAKTLTIEPWDKSILKDIEKGIVQAELGFNPVNDGKVIRIVMPQMTEENRKELIKLLSQKTEQARIALRQVRDEVKEEIVKAEKANEVTEDDKFMLIKELDDMTSEYNQKLKTLASEKEEEILKI